MSLPVWDSDTILKYKGRWNALQRLGRRIENEPTTNDTSRLILEDNAFPEPEDVSPPFKEIEVRDPQGQLLAAFVRVGEQYAQASIIEADAVDSDHQPLNYNTLYEGLAHLLFTQPDNPPYESLIRYLDGEENRRACYQEISIPKKRGGERTLTVPRYSLKWLQRSLLTVFTHLFDRHKCAHGFERGKSIVTHAKQHTGKKYVYTIDIKDFFPSITRNRVFGMLQAYPINASQPVARYLANLTCHNGCLPQGAPTSPILSNLLCRRLDSRLFKWARQNGYAYSRYADDLTFSTNNDSFPDSDIAFIDDIIRDEGFEVNKKKRRLQPYYKRQMVTGLVVNEKLNLPREKLRGLRALLHNIEHHGWGSQVNRTSFFEDADEWRSYINADLSRDNFRKAERKQRKQHKLLNPAATLPHVDDEDDLREVVRGKIAFVGAVRGKDDSLYQRLLKKFNALSDRLSNFQDGVKAGKRLAQEQDPERSSSDSEEGQEHDSGNGKHPEQERTHYRNIKQWVAELKKKEGGLSPSEFRDRLSNWKDHSLEVTLFLESTTGKNVKSKKFIKRSERIAYTLDRNPYQTSRFFQKMRDQYSFKSLLHPPESDSLSPMKILGNCIAQFEELENKIPNKLKRDTKILLKKCKTWIESKQGEGKYPWAPYGEETSIQKELKEYKEKTRVDHGGIENMLQSRADKLSDEHKVDFKFPKYGTSFHTHVPSIKPALERIISSMAKDTKSDKVEISVETTEILGSMPEVTIYISDKGSYFEDKHNLSLKELIPGNTSDALYYDPNRTGLRGYARWSIIAPFTNGKVRELDVTKNKNKKWIGDMNYEGVTHRITFPKID